MTINDSAVVIKLSEGLKTALEHLRKTGLYGDTLDDVATTLVRESVRDLMMIGQVDIDEHT